MWRAACSTRCSSIHCLIFGLLTPFLLYLPSTLMALAMRLMSRS